MEVGGCWLEVLFRNKVLGCCVRAESFFRVCVWVSVDIGRFRVGFYGLSINL